MLKVEEEVGLSCTNQIILHSAFKSNKKVQNKGNATTSTTVFCCYYTLIIYKFIFKT